MQCTKAGFGLPFNVIIVGTIDRSCHLNEYDVSNYTVYYVFYPHVAFS